MVLPIRIWHRNMGYIPTQVSVYFGKASMNRFFIGNKGRKNKLWSFWRRRRVGCKEEFRQRIIRNSTNNRRTPVSFTMAKYFPLSSILLQSSPTFSNTSILPMWSTKTYKPLTFKSKGRNIQVLILKFLRIELKRISQKSTPSRKSHGSGFIKKVISF